MSHDLSKQNKPSSSKTEPYSSLNLDEKTNAIRVLDLSPGLLTDRLNGTLRVVSLDSSPAYEALSYTWGQPIEEKSICINKLYNINIRENLFNALKRLRGRVAKRTLWIDAICIDQDDKTEQGLQVAIMGNIYKNAVTVLIWLGEYPNPKWSDPFEMRRPHFKRRSNSTTLNSRGRKYALALDSAIRDNEPRWPDRAWVVQEFVLAHEIVLCLGPVTMAYDTGHIIDLIMMFPRTLEYLRAFHEKTSDMRKLTYGLGATKQSLAEAALYTSTSSCSDDRDKVYSLLSLIDDAEARFIKPNYTTNTCARTYAEATYACIVTQNNFTILELISLNQSSHLVLPSWVVDFTMEQVPNVGRLHQFFDKSVGWTREEQFTANLIAIDTEAKLLSIVGVDFDRVAAVLKIPETDILKPGDELAEFMAPFLQAVFQRFAMDGGLFDRRPVPSIYASLLLCRGARTDIWDVLRAAFLLWSDVTMFSGKEQTREGDPMWNCAQEEIFSRLSSVGADMLSYMQYALFVAGAAVVFATTNGFIGIAPATMEAGDSVFLVQNSKLPWILRPAADGYSFRGFVNVHGILDGELIAAWKDKNVHEQQYTIC